MPELKKFKAEGNPEKGEFEIHLEGSFTSEQIERLFGIEDGKCGSCIGQHLRYAITGKDGSENSENKPFKKEDLVAIFSKKEGKTSKDYAHLLEEKS